MIEASPDDLDHLRELHGELTPKQLETMSRATRERLTTEFYMFYIQIQMFDAWFNYVDNSPLSFETREHAERYVGRFLKRDPELKLRVVPA